MIDHPLRTRPAQPAPSRPGSIRDGFEAENRQPREYALLRGPEREPERPRQACAQRAIEQPHQFHRPREAVAPDVITGFTMNATSPMVFINYRRDDAQLWAQLLYSRMARHLGEDSVFMDIADIPLGRDWVSYLEQMVSRCSVFLVLIGPQWLEIRDHTTGDRRLFAERDFVRLEIEAALRRNVPVIPLFLDGASPPSACQLPKSLASLWRREGRPLRWASAQRDIDDLLSDLEQLLEEVVEPEEPSLKAMATRYAQTIGELPAWVGDQLVGRGIVTRPSDWYAVSRSQLLSISDIDGRTANDVLEALELSKDNALSRVLVVLLPRAEQSIARDLALHFDSMEELIHATVAQLMEIRGVTRKMASELRRTIDDDAVRNEIARLRDFGVRLV